MLHQFRDMSRTRGPIRPCFDSIEIDITSYLILSLLLMELVLNPAILQAAEAVPFHEIP